MADGVSLTIAPTGRRIQVDPGETVLVALHRAGVEIESPCRLVAATNRADLEERLDEDGSSGDRTPSGVECW